MSYVELPGTYVPIRMWADPNTVEPQAMQQLRNVTTLPWIKGLSVMPDVHFGKGATVGSVIAMEGAVCPAAVGVDIGCGMSAVKTSLTEEDLPDDLSGLRSRIEAVIPVGRNMHDNEVNPRRLHGFRTFDIDHLWNTFGQIAETFHSGTDRVQKQLGTLGGGNHFIEFCTDTVGYVWLMLHSGSRNIGKELAEHHISIAQTLPYNQDLIDRDLAVFVTGTDPMDAYRRDLYWAQNYAKVNRAIMMRLFQDVVREEFDTEFGARKVVFEDEISCHHNYVSEESYEGMDLLVTRKGAIRAGSGDLGIIPGSMGTGSYIVRGLGNEKAFNSASHGAGRKMSRGAAKRNFTVEDFAAQTAGVECRKDAGVLDEIPGAYKSIETVMSQQSDLVEVVAKLKQLVCVKG